MPTVKQIEDIVKNAGYIVKTVQPRNGHIYIELGPGVGIPERKKCEAIVSLIRSHKFAARCEVNRTSTPPGYEINVE